MLEIYAFHNTHPIGIKNLIMEIEHAKRNPLSNFKVLLLHHFLTQRVFFCSNYSIHLYLKRNLYAISYLYANSYL